MDLELEIPKASVKRIMKLNDEVNQVGDESIIATGKATELFIAALTEDALQIAVFNGRKTIKVDDILLAVENNQPKYQFLNEAFVGLK